VKDGRIFISYRRDDAAGEAGRLADHLLRRFGADRVFLDIETIDPGTDFRTVLERALAETVAVLVVIGRRWGDIADAGGRRRLDDPADFVRQEVERALGRGVPVVPVLVQGAALPRAEQLPASLAPLVTRQAAVLDHAEFHADVERLADRLAPLVAGGHAWWSRPWLVPAVAFAVLVVAALGGYAWFSSRDAERVRLAAEENARTERARQAAALVETAQDQRERRDFAAAVRTLDAARQLDPASPAATLRDEVAMEWLRAGRTDENVKSFGEWVRPPLAIVDASLPGAQGAHRADLLAHQGWATFLLWRDGDRNLRPADRYREALALDPDNPYANAMLAHWTLWTGNDVDEAARLFEAALRTGRAVDAVRTLQWAAYGNDSSVVRSQVETIRLADAMRRANEPLTPRQSQTMWGIYYFALPGHRDAMRVQLLRAVPPDDHLATLRWALDEFTARDGSRRQTVRYYAALLDAEAGREAKARADLLALRAELAGAGGSLLDAVEAALEKTR
jgi:tetratricopeptide (TPR) repeat protein